MTGALDWQALLKHKSALIGMAILGGMVALALLGAVLYSRADYSKYINAAEKLNHPSAIHWLGTDQVGRDVLQGIALGGMVSLGIAVKVLLVSLLIGVPLGAWSAFRGGWFDTLLMRGVDILLAFPPILLAITIMAVWGRDLSAQGSERLVFAIAIPLIPAFIRQVRAAVLVLKQLDYITAARALGASGGRTLFRHIIPNTVGPVTVIATLSVGTAILDSAGLSFLGLGVAPGQPEWGIMLNDARLAVGISYDHWWVILFPGLAIALTVLGSNLLGDGLRDTLDPRLRQR